ncbi:MAG: nucleoside-diphosphate kinase [Kiritimatiellae bacterium]|nr:nucleoside-diphosphate kinase [Kiritimatiellia bacterium]
MANELAVVVITPSSIRKSRTGGILARYLNRTGLKLAGARMAGPSSELAEAFAAHLERVDGSETGRLLADYVRTRLAPDPATGAPNRTLLLLFEGEEAIRKIAEVTGNLPPACGGVTVRDTYGDWIQNPDTGAVTHFEPAVIIGNSVQEVGAILSIWRKHLDTDAGLIHQAGDLPDGDNVQESLVMLKPDNWRRPSIRPGAIIELLSGTGLRIIGMKRFAMSVAQAERFYGPVREGLKKVFGRFGAARSAKALAAEFGFPVEEAGLGGLTDQLAPLFAEQEFEKIVAFMTGHRPSETPPEERALPGTEPCLAIVYKGVDAIAKIRDVLGATDPAKARDGSIRREFGTNVMVNAAHASDSVENARREMGILEVDRDPAFADLIDSYYGCP